MDTAGVRKYRGDENNTETRDGSFFANTLPVAGDPGYNFPVSRVSDGYLGTFTAVERCLWQGSWFACRSEAVYITGGYSGRLASAL